MLDLILLTFAVGVFVSGFWCGKRYGSYSATWGAFKAYIKGFGK